MSDNGSLSEVFTLSSPLTYFFLLLLSLIVITVRLIINAAHVVRENGGEVSYNLFRGENSFFKWTATHERKTGIILIMIVLLGILYALKY